LLPPSFAADKKTKTEASNKEFDPALARLVVLDAGDNHILVFVFKNQRLSKLDRSELDTDRNGNFRKRPENRR
jgi:hypothetical protein